MTVISAAHIAGTGKSASTNRSAWAPNLLAARLRASHGGQDHRRNRRRLACAFVAFATPGSPMAYKRPYGRSTQRRPLSMAGPILAFQIGPADFQIASISGSNRRPSAFQLRGPRGRRHAGKSVVVARRGRSFLAQRRPSSVWGADSRAAHCCHDYEGPTLLPSHCGSCGRALVVIGPAHMVGAAGPMNCPGLARLLLHRECGDRARQPLPGSLQCCSYR